MQTQQFGRRTKKKAANCGVNISETDFLSEKINKKTIHVVQRQQRQELPHPIRLVMNNAYILFTEAAAEGISNFPDLHLQSREDALPFLEGTINLFDEHRAAYDTYAIRIECSPDYPNSFPFVYEIQGRLPHNIDWHLYNDGHFCICTPIEEYIQCAQGITLTSFIQNQVVPYLHNQSFREREGYFLNERSHGLQGILESLYDLLQTRDTNKMYSLLMCIHKNDTPSRTSKCFCGSGKKYRYCHREAYQLIKSMGQYRLYSIILFLRR